MTSYDSGDLVLVPFPFTDQTASKKRPAAVISSTAYHRHRPDLLILAVTSQIRPAQGFGEAAIDEPQFASAPALSIVSTGECPAAWASRMWAAASDPSRPLVPLRLLTRGLSYKTCRSSIDTIA